MVSDVLGEFSAILHQVFSEVVFFIFDELSSTFFSSVFLLLISTFMIRFIFSFFRDSFLGSDYVDLSSEDFVRCEFFRQHRCPYGLKDFNYDWCRKYCQMGIYDDEDEYEEED